MTSYATKIPYGRLHDKCNLKVALLLAFMLPLLILITCYVISLFSLFQHMAPLIPTISRECDITIGEWIRDPYAPYYTNMNCSAIHEHQNCMKNGRPDTDFLKWRWRPLQCELPHFNPHRFLELVKGKSMLFIGDSLGRNHMESLVCLLSKVEHPTYHNSGEEIEAMLYATYNFKLQLIWSPFLVQYDMVQVGYRWEDTVYKVYLDKPDELFISEIAKFDYLILYSGMWFYRPSLLFDEKKKLIGSQSIHVDEVLSMKYYRMAMQNVFRAINKLASFNGKTYLTTVSPAHFEHGEWNSGGRCSRIRPFRSNEIRLKKRYAMMYNIQIQELRSAEREGRKRGLEFRLLDITKAMLLRPDGHPNRYGYVPGEKPVNDCLHWCLPGPIDVWNDHLLHLISM